jgi:mono/diheme cytochrome c family protein
MVSEHQRGVLDMPKQKHNHDLFTAWLAPVVVAGLLSGCGGDKSPAGGADTAATSGPATPPPAADTQPTGDAPAAGDTQAPSGGGATGAAGGAPAGGGGGEPSPKLIALGDSIFHGQAGGGTCYACHGQDGKGSAVGPNLTDSEWLNTDGSLDGIVKTIKAGVPSPKKAPAPMPPMGGATLTDDQVQAVATYEYSLSHGGGTK